MDNTASIWLGASGKGRKTDKWKDTAKKKKKRGEKEIEILKSDQGEQIA